MASRTKSIKEPVLLTGNFNSAASLMPRRCLGFTLTGFDWRPKVETTRKLHRENKSISQEHCGKSHYYKTTSSANIQNSTTMLLFIVSFYDFKGQPRISSRLVTDYVSSSTFQLLWLSVKTSIPGKIMFDLKKICLTSVDIKILSSSGEKEKSQWMRMCHFCLTG